MWTTLIISGLLVGSIYSLMALALSFTYKSSEVANFAQGDMATFSTYVALVFFASWGWPFWGAFAGALVIAFALGVILEWGLIRRVPRSGHLPPVILTLGVQLFLFGLMGELWGPEQRAFPWPLESERVLFQWGEWSVSGRQISSLLVAIGLMLALGIWLRFSRLGLLIKASQQNPLGARINGIPVPRVQVISFGISALIGGVAGLLVAPIASLDATMMWDPLIKGFAAAVLGGMRSLKGAVLGGLLLGLGESFVGFYLSLNYKSLLPLLVIVLVLWFRPHGLFDKAPVPKV
jgi:branched-chain amino acid transport system permease protein